MHFSFQSYLWAFIRWWNYANIYTILHTTPKCAVNVFVIYISALSRILGAFPICRKSVCCANPPGTKCNSIIGKLNKRMYANMIIIIIDIVPERGCKKVANCELSPDSIQFWNVVIDMNMICNRVCTQPWNLSVGQGEQAVGIYFVKIAL